MIMGSSMANWMSTEVNGSLCSDTRFKLQLNDYGFGVLTHRTRNDTSLIQNGYKISMAAFVVCMHVRDLHPLLGFDK